MLARFAFIMLAIAFVSCSKKDDKTSPEGGNTTKYYTRLQQGVNPATDTVFLIGFDTQHRVEFVKDSNRNEIWNTEFDKAGNITSVIDTYDGLDFVVKFTYNDSNQLIQAEDVTPSFTQQFKFEYADGRLSKKYAYVKYDGSNDFELYGYYTYTLVGGNITSMKEYKPDDTFVAETKFTYTKDENVLKPLAYVNNYYNNLGLNEVADLEALFNTNLIAGFTKGSVKTEYTYSYNNNKQLVSFVEKRDEGVFTRFLGY